MNGIQYPFVIIVVPIGWDLWVILFSNQISRESVQKGSYLPCVSIAGRALFGRIPSICTWHKSTRRTYNQNDGFF